MDPGWIEAAATLLASVVAIFGIRKWSTEKRGTVEYDTAMRALKAVYAVEEDVWNSTLVAGNLYEELQGGGHPDDLVPKLEAHAKRLDQALDVLDDMTTECRVVWSEGESILLAEIHSAAFEWFHDFTTGGPRLLKTKPEERGALDRSRTWIRVFLRDAPTIDSLYERIANTRDLLERVFDSALHMRRAKHVEEFKKKLAKAETEIAKERARGQKRFRLPVKAE